MGQQQREDELIKEAGSLDGPGCQVGGGGSE